MSAHWKDEWVSYQQFWSRKYHENSLGKLTFQANSVYNEIGGKKDYSDEITLVFIF